MVATTGNDPILDSLLLRLHVESACRRGGALALRPRDLDREQCLIFLREKGGTVRWQPVSPTLMAHLVAHADQRGPQDPDAPLLRYASGRPITARRYDYLWNRVGRHLPWSATQQISIHWIRHTTLKWVERNFGYAVARAYAGHTDRGHEPSATTTLPLPKTHPPWWEAMSGVMDVDHGRGWWSLVHRVISRHADRPCCCDWPT
ncbi:site-specific integrase [Saccharopolyspora sp. NPDC050389]|uniref:site-specific integrase n=1 Tax=Saccharopolyspora sp. NPDC050389 TaxID=3155516 RepID=UPI0033F7FDE5